MHEMGIDMNGQTSKHLDIFKGQHFDTIVTVCDQVREHCPLFPDDPDTIHWSTPDPALATDTASAEEVFRKTATELARRMEYLLLQIDQAAA